MTAPFSHRRDVILKLSPAPVTSIPRQVAGRKAPRPEAPVTGTPSEHDDAALRDLPVLIVEDDAAGAKLLSVVLRGAGCDTRVAPSAEDAVKILDGFCARVAVLDLVLPLMSGLLLAQRLKAEPRTRDMILIAVSAVNGGHVERLALEAGCVAYVRKPIDPLSFTRLILSHLGAAK